MSRRGQRRTMVGVVVSDKMDKTVVVSVERLVKDPTYHKFVRRHARFLDRVRIIEHRPISKRKRFKVQETLVKASAPPMLVDPA